MKTTGPWNDEQIEQFLSECRVPLRLATHGQSGFPMLVSLWFVPLEGRLWCATRGDAHIAALVERDERCAWEVSLETPPYRGVRGSAIARVVPERGREILERLIDRQGIDRDSDFAAFLLSRADDEVAIEIEPRTRVSWDFTKRMRDAA